MHNLFSTIHIFSIAQQVNYNSSLLQKSEAIGSDNAINTTKYYYPQDYPSDNLLKRMKDSFIVAPVIKEQFLVNNILKKEKENNYLSYPYGFFGVNNQLIRDVPTSKTQVLNYYGYNIKGHPLSTGPNREIITSYIWDYLNELPIAEITNADTLSVAYSSFESDGKGRWNFTGSPSPDVTAVTGKKVYLLSSGTITRTGLNNSLYYLVSYWTKTSALTITGSQSGWPKLMASVNIKGQNWSLYEHRITGQTTITLSGAFTIDELRLYPEKAQMVTYTYQPLVGITSQGDINGHIVYYEYDGMNRLVMVRDQNRNVLKKICYNYYGQKENCPQAVYWNAALSKVFKKNNCSTGYIGSSVIYSVPAGVHSSTISQDDANNFGTFDADGQNYANTTGTCTRIYYNVAKSGTFTRNNCNAGYTGSSELYYVAAATHSSFISQVDADGLAQNDVNANGQNYANTYGTCTIVCIHCTANNRKCINGVCEFGVKVYTSSTWDPSTGKYNCVYHYEFSDGSWSIDYTEVSSTSCIVG